MKNKYDQNYKKKQNIENKKNMKTNKYQIWQKQKTQKQNKYKLRKQKKKKKLHSPQATVADPGLAGVAKRLQFCSKPKNAKYIGHENEPLGNASKSKKWDQTPLIRTRGAQIDPCAYFCIYNAKCIFHDN